MAFQSAPFFPRTSLLPLGMVLLLFLVYALFPNQNPTADAYDYAASVRWQVDLWKPHHLLYNVTGLGLYKLLQTLGWHPDPLAMLQFLNSVFAGASLLVLRRILALLQKEASVQAALLLLAGASWGTMRYATENETYTLPLFFTLLGSYFWVRFQRHRSMADVLYSGFWAAFACLFHQIHFFWWLGLLGSLLVKPEKRNYRAVVGFALPALVVPLGYAVVLYINGIPFTQAHRFVFHDFYAGNVTTTISPQNFLLTFISLGRTYFEVHGRMFHLAKQSLFYIIPALFTFTTLGWLIIRLWRSQIKLFLCQTFVFRAHLGVLLLQLLFAWYAVGNAEFMVMVPALVVILVGCLEIRKTRFLYLPGLCLLIWNLTYGLLPNYFLRYSNHGCVLSYLQQNPQNVLLLQDKNSFETYAFYHTGRYPAQAYETETDPALLTRIIVEAHRQNRPVVTDFSRSSVVFSRAWLLRKGTAPGFFDKYRLRLISSCPSFYGNQALYEISIPARRHE